MKKLITDLTLKHLPHMLCAVVEVWQLEHIYFRNKFSDRREGGTGEINSAELELFNHRLLIAEYRSRIDLNKNLSSCSFLNQFRKPVSTLSRRIVLRLILRISEHKIRLNRCIFPVLCPTRCEQYTCAKQADCAENSACKSANFLPFTSPTPHVSVFLPIHHSSSFCFYTSFFFPFVNDSNYTINPICYASKC